ncbi:complement component C1q receptor [Anas acuta]|uniref:complement component C1q receptor n=1 Tax=Anas acuta TaxID=28680 RepID=UPI0035C8C4CC
MAAALLLLLLLLSVARSEDVEVLCAGTACYTLHRDNLGWNGAQEHCRNNGGNLASVGSAAEAEQLGQLMAAGAASMAWIGLRLERGRCMQAEEPLRGFSWVAGGEPGNYSAWLAEPHVTCLSTRCVILRPAGPDGRLGWVDRSCRTAVPAFLCKFSFQGMCGPPWLGGPGQITYVTPFAVRSPRMTAAPFGSLAEVVCEGGNRPAFTVCKEPLEGGGFAWHPPGPLCPAGCTHNNGGCQQLCLEEQGQPMRCACRPGYILGPDMTSCLLEHACHSNPCQGSCQLRPGGFECVCETGYVLAPDGRRCLDVDECLEGPCQHECHNTAGSFSCACRPGYQRDGNACLDVDECLQNPCRGLCRNLPGSFECLCLPGLLPQNGSGCPTTPTDREEPAGTPETTSILQTAGAPWTTSTRSPSATPSRMMLPAPTVLGSDHSPDHSADGPRLLLYYILGSLVAILVLLAFALVVLACRKRAAKREKRPAKNAADNYCWVPEQPESHGGAGGERSGLEK